MTRIRRVLDGSTETSSHASRLRRCRGPASTSDRPTSPDPSTGEARSKSRASRGCHRRRRSGVESSAERLLRDRGRRRRYRSEYAGRSTFPGSPNASATAPQSGEPPARARRGGAVHLRAPSARRGRRTHPGPGRRKVGVSASTSAEEGQLVEDTRLQDEPRPGPARLHREAHADESDPSRPMGKRG